MERRISFQIDVIILMILLLFAAQRVFADVPSLSNLTEENVKTVARDFGANFVHTTVTPASGATGFGLQIGALAGVTQSPGINDLVQENYGYIPHAGALAILYLPGGVAGEYVIVPKMAYKGVSIQNNSVALRWSPTDAFSPSGFIAFRIRGFYGDARIGYQQTVSGVPVDVKFTSFSSGADATLSFRVPYIEPYGTIGVVNLDSRLRGEGSVNIFNTTFTTAQEAKVKQTAPLYAGGFVLKLPLIQAGVEYGRVAGDQRITAKLAIEFGAGSAKALKK